MKAYAVAILPTVIACSRCRDGARSKANYMASQVSGVESTAFDSDLLPFLSSPIS